MNVLSTTNLQTMKFCAIPVVNIWVPVQGKFLGISFNEDQTTLHDSSFFMTTRIDSSVP